MNPAPQNNKLGDKRPKKEAYNTSRKGPQESPNANILEGVKLDNVLVVAYRWP